MQGGLPAACIAPIASVSLGVYCLVRRVVCRGVCICVISYQRYVIVWGRGRVDLTFLSPRATHHLRGIGKAVFR